MKAFTVLLFVYLLASVQIQADVIAFTDIEAALCLVGLCDVLSVLASVSKTPGPNDTLQFSTTGQLNAAINSTLNIAAIVFQSGSGSVFNITANAQVTISGAVSVTQGNIVQAYGVLVATGTTTVQGASAFVVNSGASATFNGGLIINADSNGANQGLVVNGGATVTINADSTLNGALTLAINSVFIIRAGTTTTANSVTSSGNTTIYSVFAFSSGTYTQAAGWVSLQSSTSATAVIGTTVTLTGTSTLKGNGNITGDFNVQDSSTFAAGNSPGTVYVNGNMAMQSTATFELDVQDANDYDRVIVQGSVSINGILYVHLLNSYQPAHGEQYTFITSVGSESGKFNIVRGDINANIGNFGATYNSHSTVAQYTGAASSSAVASVFLFVVVAFVGLLL